LPTGARVLDVGAGDGLLASLVQAARPDLQLSGIDVLVRPDTKVPVVAFDGRRIPYADSAFEVVLFVDVLHHTDDPGVLLREAARVAADSIVIKDHRLAGAFASATLSFMDWIGNARHGVALPNNYWPEPRWREAFDDLGLVVREWRTELGLYPNPANYVFGRDLHFLACLERKKPGDPAGRPPKA
jgi:SAM-dependent methyltransferase